jgi:hypothetical protein
MDLTSIFNVFSRRQEAASKPKHEVPQTTRSRVLQWWGDMCGGSLVSDEVWLGFWAEILRIIQLRLGTPLIHESFGGPPTPPGPQHALRYVLEGPAEHFLDFLEDLFRTKMYRQMNLDSNKLVVRDQSTLAHRRCSILPDESRHRDT